ncbi:uncharacterized protein LOC124296907 isoform X1 [Neodiprion virginianus]|uniref:uncharacterized protein LOC124296907 isoform X1 n=2 Tax=Neodiprion virginianus TaxID=2961670 RepID=UPI001EE6F6D1|nr:uncharacterized protein LOC124296907 isoform X1 [Neodiprion virginianus]
MMLRHLLSNLTSTEVVMPTESMAFSSSVSPLSSSLSPPASDSSMTGDLETVSSTTPASPTTRPDLHVDNATGYGYVAEHDELDYSILAAFSDMQTVFLACICTLLPLIVALGIAFGVRHVWRKYRNRRHCAGGLPWYSGVCSREDTVESLHHRPHSGSTIIQPATRVLSAQDLVNGIDGNRYICETEVMEEVALTGSTEYTSPGNHTSKNANGNIITLTLKNNHLIVETEERGLTMEDANNHKYNDGGCSFIVEVQPEYQSDEADANKGSADDVRPTVTDQQALVHREEAADDRHNAELENTKIFGSTNTGLSQSDLSVSSPGSANPSYCYGNQLEYQSGHFGYPVYAGYETDDPANRHAGELEGGSKWVEFEKSPDVDQTLVDEPKSMSFEKNGEFEEHSVQMTLEKQSHVEYSTDSTSSSMEHQDSTDASNSTDTVKSNPNLQVNGSTPNKLELMEQKALSIEFCRPETTKPIITGALLKEDTQEDTFQEQQRKLGNGTLTPDHKKEESPREQRAESAATFVPSHRRSGSIPPRLIEENLELERKKSLDIYSQIKTTTKNMLPGLSPKFEILKNEVSPIEEKRES